MVSIFKKTIETLGGWLKGLSGSAEKTISDILAPSPELKKLFEPLKEKTISPEVKEIGGWILNAFIPYLPETYKKMESEGKNVFIAYKEAWGEATEKQKTEHNIVKQEFEEAVVRKAPKQELSNILSKSPIAKSLREEGMGFGLYITGGMLKVPNHKIISAPVGEAIKKAIPKLKTFLEVNPKVKQARELYDYLRWTQKQGLIDANVETTIIDAIKRAGVKRLPTITVKAPTQLVAETINTLSKITKLTPEISNKIIQDSKIIGGATSNLWNTIKDSTIYSQSVKPPVVPPPTIPPSPAPKEMPQFAGEPVGDPIVKLNELLKAAKPLRKGLEKAYTTERAKRISEVDRFINEQIDQVGGEEGYAKILARLKGELVAPEARIAFEPLKEKLTEAELKDLFIRTWKHPYLDNWEKISAAEGFTKLIGGEIPQPKQLVLLEEIYGTDLIKNILSKRLWGAKASDFIVELMNIPRAVLATADMSAFLRQGVIEVVAHPLISAKAIGKTFQFAFSPKLFDQYFKDLTKDSLYPLMRKSGLSITDPSKALASGREEAFVSRILQKIPIVGQVVRFAERSYVGFLNKLRVDVFKTWADELLSKGLSPIKDIDTFKAVAKVVNTFTGRGALGKLDRITPELNTIFFSPRLISARFNALNPFWYAKMPKEIRMKAIGDFAKFVAVGLTTLAIIKTFGGDEVEVETSGKSSDFGKIKIGNTRWDIWGGFQQWARVFTQLVTGERKNTTTGEIVSLSKDEYPFTTRKEVLLRFIEGKLAPVPALINELISGAKTFTGEDITFETVAKEKFIPMYIQDIADAYADGGLGRAVGAGIPAFFGVGVQTWEEQKRILPPAGMPLKGMPGLPTMPGIKTPTMPGIPGRLPPMPGI